MKRIIKKALLALTAITLIATIAVPKNVIAATACSRCGAPSCLCSVLESQYHCGDTKYEHGVIYTLECLGTGSNCKPEWMKSVRPTQATGSKSNTTSHNNSEHHQVDLNTNTQFYAINPALDVNGALAIANTGIEEYNSQITAYYAAYYNAYAEQLALYEAVIKDTNAQITASLNTYAEQMALYEAMMNSQNAQ